MEQPVTTSQPLPARARGFGASPSEGARRASRTGAKTCDPL